jgi:subtilisin family serine protease
MEKTNIEDMPMRTTLNFNKNMRLRKATVLGLATILGLLSMSPAAISTPESQPITKGQPQSQPKFDLRRLSAQDRQDLVFVMPNANADTEELDDVLRENNGTVVGQLGTGTLKVMIVKVQRGQAAKVERKLQSDKKHFDAVNSNHIESSCAAPTDPGLSAMGAWHFDKLHLSEAWEVLSKNRHPQGVGMYVLDSGCDTKDVNRSSQGSNVTGDYKKIGAKLWAKMVFNRDVEDHMNFIIHKGNEANTLTYDFTDQNGHGTAVATSAAGIMNGQGSIGVNPGLFVHPIKIADGPYNATISTDDFALISAMMCIYDISDAKVNNMRIINISYANMFDENKHPVLHQLFKHWYYKKGGLIFVSAGNDGRNLSSKDKPYLNVVSGMGAVKDMALAHVPGGPGFKDYDSCYGPCVDFTAPGENVEVTDVNGMPRSVNGTSFSSPLVAGIASLVWNVKPNLTNYDVEDILRRSATNFPLNGRRNPQFGWGMPDAGEAIRLALRR